MNKRVERTERILGNGMKVVLLYKKDFVQSLFMIGIPAGGRNTAEREVSTGQKTVHPTGCAHYLEHQNFRLNGQDVTPLLASMQAQTNAFTSYTETCYYVSTSADIYGPLGVLIDFVQTLDISDQSVEKERGIILSELHMDENQPESRIFHETFRSLYRNAYLKNDILGTEEDISRMSAADLESFYAQFYDPSRIVLVGVTGQDPQKILSFIEKKEKNFPSQVSRNSALALTFEDEPEQCAREEFSLQMDVYQPYQAIGVKLKPAKTIDEALRLDYIVNFWLDAMMGPMNPDYQEWIDERILSQMSGAEADISTDYGYMIFYSQTEQPDRFRELAEQILNEKKPVDPNTYESLRIMYRANSLRTLDNFEGLALDHVRGAFQKFDPLLIPDQMASISLEEINDTIASLDFSMRCFTRIDPLQTQVSEQTKQ